MRISIHAVGRMKQGPERELVARYLERAAGSGKPLGLTGFSVTELTESRAGSPAARKAEEARSIREHLPGDVQTIALDERHDDLRARCARRPACPGTDRPRAHDHRRNRTRTS